MSPRCRNGVEIRFQNNHMHLSILHSDRHESALLGLFWRGSVASTQSSVLREIQPFSALQITLMSLCANGGFRECIASNPIQTYKKCKTKSLFNTFQRAGLYCPQRKFSCFKHVALYLFMSKSIRKLWLAYCVLLSNATNEMLTWSKMRDISLPVKGWPASFLLRTSSNKEVCKQVLVSANYIRMTRSCTCFLHYEVPIDTFLTLTLPINIDYIVFTA